MALTFNSNLKPHIDAWRNEYEKASKAGDKNGMEVAFRNMQAHADYMDDGTFNGSFSRKDVVSEFDITDPSEAKPKTESPEDDAQSRTLPFSSRKLLKTESPEDDAQSRTLPFSSRKLLKPEDKKTDDKKTDDKNTDDKNTDDKNTDDKNTDTGPLNTVAKNLQKDDPKLFDKVNDKFTVDGKVDARARNVYLEKMVGNDKLTSEERSWLRRRFDDDAHIPMIKNANDFRDRIKDPSYLRENPEKTKYVTELLDKYKDDQYVLDQLFSRFAGKDGKLNNNEVRALNDYIKGHIRFDFENTIGLHNISEDWKRIEGQGARPKEEAVKELIKDPTVLSRMPGGSFTGDLRSQSGGIRDSWMDDENGYLEGDGYMRWRSDKSKGDWQ